MTIKTGLAKEWGVRFIRTDGHMTAILYGSNQGPMISKLRIIKEAKAELQRNPDFAEIDEIYPVGGDRG